MPIILLLSCAILIYAVLSTTHSRPRPAGGGKGSTPLNMPTSTNAPPLRARIVYEWNSGIYSTRTDTGFTRKIADEGKYPRWSPDGRSIAYWRGTNHLVQADADGGNPVVLARAEEPRGIAYHPDGLDLYFVDQNAVKSVSLANHTVRTRLEGYRFVEIDLAPGNRFVASIKSVPNHYLLAFDLATGRHWKLGHHGCSASLSPDGQYSTRNAGNHRRLSIDDWASGKMIRSLPAPPRLLNDNQFWSNHADWIASVMQGGSTEIYIQRVSDARYWRVTFCGGCDRPDLYVPRDGQADG
jgi:hypothetical protein